MAGYEPLQEGLAVLAEYLVGALSNEQLRRLAGRVLAARCVAAGADFVETFGMLHTDYGFHAATAFGIAMRVHRGGGFTKDAVYLQGLIGLLEYLQAGNDLEMLYLGKLALEHIGLIEELRWRRVLASGPLRPRHLDNPAAQALLQRLRDGLTVLDLAT